MLPNLESRFKALEVSRNALFNHLSALDGVLLYRRPSQDAWSLAEIAQHLLLVESEILRQLKAAGIDQSPRTLRDRAGRMAVHFVFRRGIRVKAPMRSVLPLPGKSLDEIRETWNEVRLDLSAHLNSLPEGNLDRLVFRHPVAGRMTIEQTLDLLASHFNHHQRQFDRTQREVGA